MNHGELVPLKNTVLTEAAIGTPERLTAGTVDICLRKSWLLPGLQDTRLLLKRALIGF